MQAASQSITMVWAQANLIPVAKVIGFNHFFGM
jgi:hypothetical protein